MKRHGFSLLELLVVIAILAILVGIVLPGLQIAKQRGRTLVCESNVRQISLALSIYEQEHGTFPHGFDASPLPGSVPPGDCPGTVARDFQGWWWFHSLPEMAEASLKPGSVLWCPSRDVEDPYILCGNYGVNRAICRDSWASMSSEFKGKPMSLAQMRSPSLTLLVTDSGYSLISWRGAAREVDPVYENSKREGDFYVPGLSINKDRNISPGSRKDAIDGRHLHMMINVGFSDGHVDRLKADKLALSDSQTVSGDYASLWSPR